MAVAPYNVNFKERKLRFEFGVLHADKTESFWGSLNFGDEEVFS